MSNFNSYSDFIKSHFGERVQKISIHAGLNCPNRDGTKGVGGCIYCRNDAFTPSYCKAEKDIELQINEGIDFHKKRYRRANKYLAYFQSYSNTYTSSNELALMFEQALKVDGVVGIAVGTRPDCIDQSIIEVLEYYSKKTFVKIELGIESVYDKTLEFINRGHSFEDVLTTINLLNKSKLRIGGHFIIGLPTESREEMLNSAKIISELGLFSIKLHQLQIFKDTKLESLYVSNSENFEMFELEEYVNFIVSFCEKLDPRIFIERFAGEVPPRYLVAPDWGQLRYDSVLIKIIERFKKNNTFQGKFFVK